MLTNEMNYTTMPRHYLANASFNPAPRANTQPRKPAPIGLSREELRKIVVELMG